MAQGPDPNRALPTDPENTPDELDQGGGLGNPRSSRLGLSSWTIALLAVIVVVALIGLMW